TLRPTAVQSPAPEIRKAIPVQNQATMDFSPLPQRPLTPAEIFRRVRPSVVLLTMQDARGQPIALGSGFFVDRDIVATNFHVVDGAAAGFAKVPGATTKLDIKGTIGVAHCTTWRFCNSMHHQWLLCQSRQNCQSISAIRCTPSGAPKAWKAHFRKGWSVVSAMLARIAYFRSQRPFHPEAVAARFWTKAVPLSEC